MKLCETSLKKVEIGFFFHEGNVCLCNNNSAKQNDEIKVITSSTCILLCYTRYIDKCI